ncbi:MAG: HDOD domain-containing protein, partial [Pseudomonadota bacterium]
MSEYFIGRQPIFDASMNLFAYELLFRDNNGGGIGSIDGGAATLQVISNTVSEIGLSNLVGQHFAFVNLTRHFLLHPELILFPPERTVLEILEDIEVDDAVIEGVANLRRRGFTIALDDFVPNPKLQPLIDLADIIKLEIPLLDAPTRKETVERLREQGKRILAEKVETVEEYEELKTLGFDYYQGYFFAKPKILSGKKLPSNRLALVELATKVHQPDIEIDELHRLVSTDVALSVKALRFANSAANGLRAPVDNLRQAITFLGTSTLKNWVSVLVMSDIDGKPTELLTMALTRARLCELMAA